MSDNNCAKQGLEVQDRDFIEVLELFQKQAYYATGETPQVTVILKRCIAMLELDYKILVLNNKRGTLCDTYPSHIPIQMHGLDPNNSSTIHEDSAEPGELYNMFKEAQGARCRQRFAVPVILYKGKYVCRSATLAVGCEIVGRKGVNMFLNVLPNSSDEREEPVCTSRCCDSTQPENAQSIRPDSNAESMAEIAGPTSIFEIHTTVRSADIKLLKRFHVGSIVDLMVENKKSKMGVTVSSSEKVDKEKRYSDFHLVAMPYPGCEHFTQFYHSNFEAVGIKFDWDPTVCDANINVPEVPALEQLKITWNDFRDWDLVLMTQNYLKYMLKYLQDNTFGMLVHCISGWDRTPLFISLIRLSLWADGVVHQNLNEAQILYLTIAYDWYLFSHRLPQRLARNEAIFLFCFYVLKYIMEDDFSVVDRRRARKSEPKAEDKTDSQDGFDCEVFTSQEVDESNGNSPQVNNFMEIPAQIRKTSPVQVPIKRTDSNASSMSWQIITGTGSLLGSESKLDDFDPPTPPLGTPPCRQTRLSNLRQLFYKFYFQTVGKNMGDSLQSFF